MSIVRYEPWSVFHQLQNDINRLFESREAEGSSATADWAPLVDIVEFNDRYELRADLPGVDPEGVDITLEAGVLIISGAREVELAEDAERRRIERVRGRFQRSFTLPDTVEADKVTARSQNGVLEVSIPKRPAAQPLRIKVAA